MDPRREAEPERAAAALWERGRAAWPRLALDREVFRDYLRDRAPGEPGAADVPQGRAEDLYLACACLERVKGAVDAFDVGHWPRIAPHLRRFARDDDRLAELRQLLLIRLFVPAAPDQPAKIAEYSGRGPLEAWARMAATRIALNGERGRGRETALDDSLAGRLARSTEMELSFIRGIHEEDFRAAIQDGLAGLAPDQRLALKLCYRERLTMDGLAAALGTSRSAAHRKLSAAREELRQRVRASLSARLALTPTALESMLELFTSRILPALSAELRDRLGGR